MDCTVRRVTGRGVGSVIALAVLLAPLPVAGQTQPKGLDLTTVEAPRSDTGKGYQAMVRRRADTDAIYATDLQGGPLTVDSRPRRAEPLAPRGPLLDGNIAMLVVVGGLALMLLLWLRFGGGGLLARTPADAPAPVVTPEGWDAPAGTPGCGLLARAAAMADRRAALVLLLRACLLHAATVTGTRLARSDTERKVLARLPGSFAALGPLAELLRRTELAHYGGRDVSDADFTASLGAARHLLGAAHG
jgi:hypothetical protein